MKVGIVSDSPAITTGYGIVTDRCCRALLAAGHEVTCFGFKDTVSNPRRHNYGCPIQPINPFEPWHAKLREFVTREALDVLWIYMDIYNLEEVMNALGETAIPPLSLYAIFDGLPAYRRLLKLLRNFRTIVVTTNAVARYLEAEGYAISAVAPPGVDASLFQPLDRQALRTEAGVDDAFVVGVFGRNTERKQHPRVLQAVRNLIKSGTTKLFIYFHCAERSYWDLPDLAERWGVRDHTIFADELVDETRGVPVRQHRHGRKVKVEIARIPASFGYVERLNLCDLVINVPHSGDFEQVLIEAPACGVPVAGTDDSGIMREALGPGWPLTASECGLGNVGQKINFVAIESIAEGIRALMSDKTRHDAMVAAGRDYAARHKWEFLGRTIVSAVESAAYPTRLNLGRN